MDRTRSVSESQYHAIYPLKKSHLKCSVTSSASTSKQNSSSLTSLCHVANHNKSRRDSAKNSLNKVLLDYKFLGNIVTFKTEEAYGFIRSEQVTGDVFFSLHHLDIKNKDDDINVDSFLGKWVHFTVKDIGKKSMEARKVSLVPSSTSVIYLKGRVMSWVKTGNGCLLQVTSGLGLKHLNNRIFAPFVETKGIEQGVTGTEVSFKIHVDRNFKKEGRDVMKTENNSLEPEKEVVKTRKQRRRTFTEGASENNVVISEADKLMSVKHLTTEEFSDELVSSIETMDSVALLCMFDKQLKARLSVLAQQPVGSKVVIAVIRRVAKLERNNVEEKITRMMMATFMDICTTKQGCAVVQAGLDHFSQVNKIMLAEMLLELDTVEQYTALWVQGSYIFSMMLNLLDESSLATVGFTLSGHYVNLACHIRHYKPVKSLLVNLVRTETFPEILPEIEQELVNLSCNKFGHIVVSALLQNTPPHIKARLIKVYTGQLANLSMHPVCHSVIVTALEEGTDTSQAAFIEEVCTVSNNEADMAVIRLTKNRYGHLVVLAMLKVSRHKQVHNLLKASILCKQEEVVDNEFVAKVLKTIKTEFHSRSVGNYCKRDH